MADPPPLLKPRRSLASPVCALGKAAWERYLQLHACDSRAALRVLRNDCDRAAADPPRARVRGAGGGLPRAHERDRDGGRQAVHGRGRQRHLDLPALRPPSIPGLIWPSAASAVSKLALLMVRRLVGVAAVVCVLAPAAKAGTLALAEVRDS